MRTQVRITLPQSLRAPIDAPRTRWNPEVATNNPAHATIVYHDEAPELALLRIRLDAICRRTMPIPLVLGRVRRFDEPARGAFLEVCDPTQDVRRLRAALLTPPFRARARFGLHLTLLHPAQGERLAEAWNEIARLAARGRFQRDVARCDRGRRRANARAGIVRATRLTRRAKAAPTAERARCADRA